MMPDLIATFAREMSVKVMGWELLNVAMLGLMWVLGFVDVGEAAVRINIISAVGNKFNRNH